MENRTQPKGITPKEKLLTIIDALNNDQVEKILQYLSAFKEQETANNIGLAKYLDNIIKEDANLLKRLAK